jgi:hypothetical protein
MFADFEFPVSWGGVHKQGPIFTMQKCVNEAVFYDVFNNNRGA